MALAEVDIPQQGYLLEHENGDAGLGGQRTLNRLSYSKVIPSGGAQQQHYKQLPARLNVTKLLVHPGEVNSFKCWPLNRRVIASHSDHSEIFVWDFNLQPSALSKLRSEPSGPNIRLQGHVAQPTYALAWSDCAAVLASGSRDGTILLWDLSGSLDAKAGFRGVNSEVDLEDGGRRKRRAKEASGLAGAERDVGDDRDDRSVSSTPERAGEDASKF